MAFLFLLFSSAELIAAQSFLKPVAEHRKAYIACEGNNKLIVFNMQTHRVEKTFPVGDGPDVLAFDRGLQLLYAAREAGVDSAFQYGDNQLRKIDDLKVGPNSHSVLEGLAEARPSDACDSLRAASELNDSLHWSRRRTRRRPAERP